ncbi:hypothetical protein [Mycobacterium angelicum]|uniref:Uncharacterized protein n=1 Tax=Mycobacterium angelicum TaxID=470074 RepID=A0A1W9ZYZ4_MYCAN|nr:hypothetical protein [Mycobacterium angelicum]MCV7199059.1 hypothetical protein [Mycobacterium angelicum]ORA23010.1 hypothetical protein BST12_08400 [Mycobacterium angelicum]
MTILLEKPQTDVGSVIAEAFGSASPASIISAFAEGQETVAGSHFRSGAVKPAAFFLLSSDLELSR